MLRGIGAQKFAPFGELRWPLPPVEGKPNELGEVHILTGANGTGKTRILALIAAMLGDATHLKNRHEGGLNCYATAEFPVPSNLKQWNRAYFDGDQISLIENLQNLAAFAYSGGAYISDAPVTAMADVEKPTRKSCLIFGRPADSSKALLQAITNLMIEAGLEGFESIDRGNAMSPAKVLGAIESTLTELTGADFSFEIIRYPKLSLGVRWGSTSLSFNRLPDGLRSIIGWMVHSVVMMDIWLQRKSDPTTAEAIFLLDEIESHLHPAWQRRILPAFQRLFPNSQIIVATHSPFVIASLNHGWIHPIVAGSDGIAKIREPISASKGDSYVSVLEDIMGVKEWFDPETETLLSSFRRARDEAYRGNIQSRDQARDLASQIASRSKELEFMMGREVLQMDRQLNGMEKVK